MNKQKFGNKKVASTKFKGKFDKQKLKHAKEMTHAGAPAAPGGAERIRLAGIRLLAPLGPDHAVALLLRWSRPPVPR